MKGNLFLCTFVVARVKKNIVRMRSAITSSILLRVLILFCILPNMTVAQYYIDSSDNLPDADASFQTKDVLAVDIDGDGDMDVVIANEFQNNVVLINDGMGVFTRGGMGIPLDEEHDSEAITIADFSGNEELDLIFVSEDDFEHEYYWNEGSGNFIEPALSLPLTNCRAVDASDFNGDNIPDLMLGNNGQNFMLINDGVGAFINETFDRIPFVDDKTQDIATNDIDNDGDLDIFLADEDSNRLLINDGTGVFVDESAERLPQGVNLDSRTGIFEDVDMDGDSDLFLCNVEFSVGKNPKNRLYLNDGNGFFTDHTDTNTPDYTDQTLDAVFTDLDFDGDPDLILANILGIQMSAYLNDGNGKFTDHTELIFGTPYTIEAFSITKADFNGDDVEDIYIGNKEGKDILLIRDPNVVANKAVNTIDAKLFPNPVYNKLVLEGDFLHDFWTFQIFDLAGNLIVPFKQREVSDQQITFELPRNIANGIYFLNAVSNHKEGRFKFVLIR